MPLLYVLVVGALSASVLSYEIALTRVLAITQWHHLAHAVISLALLGFGASGTILSLLRERCRRSFHLTFFVTTAGFSISALLCFWLSQRLPLNPFMLLWDKREWGHLALFYTTLSVPFFFAASAIGVAFIHFRERIAQVYAADLLGASAGALGAIGLLYLMSPQQIVVCVSVVSLLCTAAVALRVRRRWMVSALALGLLLLVFFAPRLSLSISPYKELSIALDFPEVEVMDTHSSPLGWLHLLDSSAFHHAPGLSLAYQGTLPRQRGIFVDAGGMSPVVRFQGEWPDYLDHMTSSLSHHLVDRPEVLVLGAGGGADVLSALTHGAKHVDAVELNPKVVEWVRAQPEFAGGIYDSERYPVRLFVKEARGFVEASEDRYDLIQLTLIESVSASSAGVYALTESYLYTLEAMRSYLERLKPGGVLAITRWLKQPPRDTLKMFATAVDACGEDASRQLALIRSWRTGTLLIKNGAYTGAETARIRQFCRKRNFDLAYLPDIRSEEVNRYHQLERPIYYEACQELLSSGRDRFIEEYPFQIRPATDERPYFFHFFRWESFNSLRQQAGNAWFPVEEWGYLLSIATLVQGVVLSLLLIVAPLFALPRKQTTIWIFLYFLALGIGFMFIEIASIQRFILFLSHPTYAIAVVLCAFLLFAGIGSSLASRYEWTNRRFGYVIVGIAVLAVAHTIALEPLFHRLMGLADVWKISLSLLLIAPLAVCMGIPFPVGLQRVSDRAEQAVPWAWGINGCASVISAVLASLAAMSIGFSGVTHLAVGVYVLAGFGFSRM